MSFTFEDLTAQQIEALARAHIQLFEGRLASESKHVNTKECEHYLEVWADILIKVETWNDVKEEIPYYDWKEQLTEEERGEIKDACYDGGYDRLLESVHALG